MPLSVPNITEPISGDLILPTDSLDFSWASSPVDGILTYTGIDEIDTIISQPPGSSSCSLTGDELEITWNTSTESGDVLIGDWWRQGVLTSGQEYESFDCPSFAGTSITYNWIVSMNNRTCHTSYPSSYNMPFIGLYYRNSNDSKTFDINVEHNFEITTSTNITLRMESGDYVLNVDSVRSPPGSFYNFTGTGGTVSYISGSIPNTWPAASTDRLLGVIFNPVITTVVPTSTTIKLARGSHIFTGTGIPSNTKIIIESNELETSVIDDLASSTHIVRDKHIEFGSLLGNDTVNSVNRVFFGSDGIDSELECNDFDLTEPNRVDIWTSTGNSEIDTLLGEPPGKAACSLTGDELEITWGDTIRHAWWFEGAFHFDQSYDPLNLESFTIESGNVWQVDMSDRSSLNTFRGFYNDPYVLINNRSGIGKTFEVLVEHDGSLNENSTIDFRFDSGTYRATIDSFSNYPPQNRSINGHTLIVSYITGSVPNDWPGESTDRFQGTRFSTTGMAVDIKWWDGTDFTADEPPVNCTPITSSFRFGSRYTYQKLVGLDPESSGCFLGENSSFIPWLQDSSYNRFGMRGLRHPSPRGAILRISDLPFIYSTEDGLNILTSNEDNTRIELAIGGYFGLERSFPGTMLLRNDPTRDFVVWNVDSAYDNIALDDSRVYGFRRIISNNGSGAQTPLSTTLKIARGSIPFSGSGIPANTHIIIETNQLNAASVQTLTNSNSTIRGQQVSFGLYLGTDTVNGVDRYFFSEGQQGIPDDLSCESFDLVSTRRLIQPVQQAYELVRNTDTSGDEYWNGTDWQSNSGSGTRIVSTSQELTLTDSQWLDSDSQDSTTSEYDLHKFKLRLWDNSSSNNGDGAVTVFSTEILLNILFGSLSTMSTSIYTSSPFGTGNYGVAIREIAKDVLVVVTQNADYTQTRVWFSTDKGDNWSQATGSPFSCHMRLREINATKMIERFSNENNTLSGYSGPDAGIVSDTIKELNSIVFPVSGTHLNDSFYTGHLRTTRTILYSNGTVSVSGEITRRSFAHNDLKFIVKDGSNYFPWYVNVASTLLGAYRLSSTLTLNELRNNNFVPPASKVIQIFGPGSHTGYTTGQFTYHSFPDDLDLEGSPNFDWTHTGNAKDDTSVNNIILSINRHNAYRQWMNRFSSTAVSQYSPVSFGTRIYSGTGYIGHRSTANDRETRLRELRSVAIMDGSHVIMFRNSLTDSTSNDDKLTVYKMPYSQTTQTAYPLDLSFTSENHYVRGYAYNNNNLFMAVLEATAADTWSANMYIFDNETNSWSSNRGQLFATTDNSRRLSTERYPFSETFYAIDYGIENPGFYRVGAHEPPNTPSLISPISGTTVTENTSLDFEWSFNSPSGANQSAYELSRRTETSGIQYWNGTSWQSTIDSSTRITATRQSISMTWNQWVDMNSFVSETTSYDSHYFKVRVWDDTGENGGVGFNSQHSSEVLVNIVGKPTLTLDSVNDITFTSGTSITVDQGIVNFNWTSSMQDSFKIDLYESSGTPGTIGTTLLNSTDWVSNLNDRRYEWVITQSFDVTRIWFVITIRSQNIESDPVNVEIVLDWGQPPQAGMLMLEAVDLNENVVLNDNGIYRAFGIKEISMFEQMYLDASDDIVDNPVIGTWYELTLKTTRGSLHRRIVGSTADPDIIIERSPVELSDKVIRCYDESEDSTTSNSSGVMSFENIDLGQYITGHSTAVATEETNAGTGFNDTTILKIVNSSSTNQTWKVETQVRNDHSSDLTISINILNTTSTPSSTSSSRTTYSFGTISSGITEEKGIEIRLSPGTNYIWFSRTGSNSYSLFETRLALKTDKIIRVFEYSDFEVEHSIDYEYRNIGYSASDRPSELSDWFQIISH